ncbi:hypothetical protein CC1G_11366 [Coprinopsis cinerea okayama7|uniref:Uncharacterized protein n=1 Tax=Coprinopsis cinerea (strain Okayama-7 / 130 / ATCC MYA-4618 / FGSC 9003) TaxID=240176 RepID=A8P8X3_COPC7|nr:hypothetical protein CC1G_11366 [Coprinopsis cinerea okayama7\|eukprot:XP_001839655.1 hypothetical protein CC1G_11366 [Coprinopsis cinerea okayama7\
MRNSERLYTSLIFRASRKYASWDPEIPMEVGDYGIITSGGKRRHWKSVWTRKRRANQRGIFVKEGNVYTDGFAEAVGLPLPQEYGGDDPEGVTWVTSKSAREIDVEAAAGGQTPVFAECKAKAAFRFTSKAGAVLVMKNDSITTLHPAAKLRFLFDEPSLHGKVIVSEVHRCSSYARYVSSGKTSSVAIGLTVTNPEATKLFGDVETGAETRWMKSVSSGNFKTRTRKDGKRAYYPLFRLVSLDEKGLATGLRGGEEGEEGDPPLPDVLPPWMEEDEETDDTLVDASDESDAESQASDSKVSSDR